MATKKDQLKPLELQPWRVLVVAAHPGDIEYSASAAIAKWTSEGAEVVYLIASRGEASLPGTEPDQAALIRSGEQSAAAAAVGVQLVDFLDVDDGVIELTIALRRAIVASIRRFGPDVVLVMNHRDDDADGAYNHADHRAVGTATLDAIASAANQWVFRDIGKPHSVDVVLVTSSPSATHAIDVSGFEDAAAAALAAHEQHLVAVSAHPMADPAWLLNALKESAGRLPSSTSAIPVERIDFAQGHPCQSYIVKEVEDEEGQLRIMRLPEQAQLSQTPTRARNAAPRTAASRKNKKERKNARTPRAVPTAPVEQTGTIKFKARLDQKGRSIGIEVPDSIMERLGGGKRPEITVSVNSTEFQTFIGTSGGKRFVAINAERRKIAAIDVNDTFFVTLSLCNRELM